MKETRQRRTRKKKNNGKRQTGNENETKYEERQTCGSTMRIKLNECEGRKTTKLKETKKKKRIKIT